MCVLYKQTASTRRRPPLSSLFALATQIDIVDSVTLAPYERKTVVASFRPSALCTGAIPPSDATEGGEFELESAPGEFRTPRRQYPIIKVKGQIVLSATRSAPRRRTASGAAAGAPSS